ncbi:MAG: hypothetical protein H6913_07810 [Altererythrobacter sp.]|nr:hypothetical protein [Altererythrobacter sp.]
MACFPKIDSPCPYKGDIVDIMDGDICSLCSKPVYDLTDLDDEGRHDLLAGRSGEMCVSYRLGARAAMAAAAMGASVVAVPTMAQDSPDPANSSTDDAASAETDEHTIFIVVGGLRKPDEARWIALEGDARPVQKGRELPVEYDDEPAPKKADSSGG